MTADETTRIEFAERCGMLTVILDGSAFMAYNPTKFVNLQESLAAFGATVVEAISNLLEFYPDEIPNPSNHNHVHAALMGMNDGEWAYFSYAVSKSFTIPTRVDLWTQLTKAILKTPLPILVSCYLEATKERKPK